MNATRARAAVVPCGLLRGRQVLGQHPAEELALLDGVVESDVGMRPLGEPAPGIARVEDA